MARHKKGSGICSTPEKRRLYQRRYYWAHKEKQKEYQRQYREGKKSTTTHDKKKKVVEVREAVRETYTYSDLMKSRDDQTAKMFSQILSGERNLVT